MSVNTQDNENKPIFTQEEGFSPQRYDKFSNTIQLKLNKLPTKNTNPLQTSQRNIPQSSSQYKQIKSSSINKTIEQLLKTKQKVPNYLNSRAQESENPHLSKDKQDSSHNSHKNETIIKESPVISRLVSPYKQYLFSNRLKANEQDIEARNNILDKAIGKIDNIINEIQDKDEDMNQKQIDYKVILDNWHSRPLQHQQTMKLKLQNQQYYQPQQFMMQNISQHQRLTMQTVCQPQRLTMQPQMQVQPQRLSVQPQRLRPQFQSMHIQPQRQRAAQSVHQHPITLLSQTQQISFNPVVNIKSQPVVKVRSISMNVQVKPQPQQMIQIQQQPRHMPQKLNVSASNMGFTIGDQIKNIVDQLL